MKGKGKVIAAHIFNALGILAAGFLTIAILVSKSKKEKLDMILGILFIVIFVVILIAEIILIVFQAKHKYGKAVFISGLASSIFVIISLGAALITAYFIKKNVVLGILLEGGEILLITGIVNTILYPLIRKSNVGVSEPAPKAVTEQKIEAPVVEDKPVAEKKPASIKKAPAKKATPKKVTTKKPVAKKKPATKKKSK